MAGKKKLFKIAEKPTSDKKENLNLGGDNGLDRQQWITCGSAKWWEKDRFAASPLSTQQLMLKITSTLDTVNGSKKNATR
jgi:hypothetical protein